MGDIVGLYQDQNRVLHGFEATPTTIRVAVDIKPQGCPNPFNVGAQGVLPVAILGTASFDVTTVDPSSVKLQGVPVLHFSDQAISAALGSLADGQVLGLTLTGKLLPQFGGTAIRVQDVVVVINK